MIQDYVTLHVSIIREDQAQFVGVAVQMELKHAQEFYAFSQTKAVQTKYWTLFTKVFL